MRHPSRRGALLGYTLIELLVVAAIMGALVVTTALAWRNDPARVLEAEARRLAAQIELAIARARIGGARIAISTRTHAYQFWRREPRGTWHVMTPDDDLAVRVLPAGIEITAIHVAGIMTAHGERIAIAPDDDLAITIALTGFGARATVSPGNYDGRMDVRLTRAHE